MLESDYIDVLNKLVIYTVRLVIYANSLSGCGMHISSTISLSHLLDQVVKPPLPLQERRERGKKYSRNGIKGLIQYCIFIQLQHTYLVHKNGRRV